MFGVRGAAIRAAGLLGYLVIARILGPHELGVAAIGLTFAFLSSFLADLGLGGALIRSGERPTRQVLSALVGFQMLVVAAMLVPLLVWAVAARTPVAIVAVLYVIGVLPVALRAPLVILLERRLDFRPLLLAEVAEVVIFNVVAVAAVGLGAGVVGLALASIIKTSAGTLLLLRMAGSRLEPPSHDLRSVRGLMRFGFTMQAAGGVAIIRDQAWNYGVLVLAGFGTLGLWTLASKVMSVPSLAIESLWRLSFPALSRLSEEGDDLRPVVRRGVVVVAVVAVGTLTPLVTGAPELVPLILGDKWRGAVAVIPIFALAVAISAPISTVVTGLLYARGEAGLVLRANVVVSAVSVVAGLAALPSLGVTGLALGLLAGAAVDSAVLGVVARRRLGVGVVTGLAKPLTAGLVAVGASRLLLALVGPTGWSAVAAAVISLTMYIGLAITFDRSSATLVWSLLRRGIDAAGGGPLGHSTRESVSS